MTFNDANCVPVEASPNLVMSVIEYGICYPKPTKKRQLTSLFNLFYETET